MAFQVIGTGTTHYGVGAWQGNSYVTTRWVSIVGLPIYPLESYRVESLGAYSSGPFSRSEQFRILERLPLQRRQVVVSLLLIYSYVAFVVAFMVGVAKHVPYFEPWSAVVAVMAPMAAKVAWDLRQRAKAKLKAGGG